MSNEHHEHQATNAALNAIYQYISPGTNEGISFTISRLTDDLFTDSFLGGGDISLFTPSGNRGKLTSQQSDGQMLDSGGGAPKRFPIQLGFDLNTGTLTGNWTNPVTSQAENVSVQVELLKDVNTAEEQYYIFYGDSTSDDAGYALTFALL